eukprot:1298468-Ditylum_brightwellii.AAC.1
MREQLLRRAQIRPHQAIRDVLHEDPKSGSLKDLTVLSEDEESILIETGSGSEIKEVGAQVEPEGEEYPTVDEHNERDDTLIHEPSVSQQGTPSQHINLTD